MKKTILGCLILILANGCSKDMTVSPTAQLALDIAAIDDYLTSNNIVAQTDPSGLRYVITLLGTGVKPVLANKITVRYTGKLLKTGSVFDQNATAAGATFPLSGLIQGWQIGFQLLPKGSKATLYIPSGLCYAGSPPSGSNIPANANLFFDVELINVTN